MKLNGHENPVPPRPPAAFVEPSREEARPGEAGKGVLDPGAPTAVTDSESLLYGFFGGGDFGRLGLMAGVIVFSLVNHWTHWLEPNWLALAATAVGGWPIYAEAWHNLRRRKMTMELSMTIALVAAVCIGEFFTALLIAFFVLFAERVEGLTMARGRRAISDLLKSLPRTVLVLRDGREVSLPAEKVAAGETVVVRPGERIATDGTVLRGESSANEASITGESLPVAKEPGSHVFAGTLNEDGVLYVRAERLGRDTTFGKIVQIVEQAEQSQAPVERLADRLAVGLIVFALMGALLTLAVQRDFQAAISVILVAGACGVAAGTPLALLAGVGGAARRGIIVKGGVYLEQMAEIDTVVLDKTGTLTRGVPEVRQVRAATGLTQAEVLALAAGAEIHSEHPLGQAIVRRARKEGLSLAPLEAFRYVPGRGLACVLADGGGELLVGSPRMMEERGIGFSAFEPAGAGESVVMVARGTRPLGVITLADEIRTEAADSIRSLGRLGYRTMMLSGDAPAAATAVGERLGITESEGGMLPQEKLERVRHLIGSGRKVAMVGDGVNDAPALAEATVGIAMGNGSDVALETADVTLMKNDLSRLVEALAISVRCRGVIRFNFWGTILVDGAGMVLAFLGMLSPVQAALIHVGSELAFILNSARLFRHWR